MRKQITAGLLALSLSFLTSSVFAGTIQVCEEIKSDPAYKGLYGLCNAYWNETDPDARADILAAFEEKAGPDGPSMPGIDEPPPADFACPCWDDATYAGICSLGAPESIVSFSGITIITFDGLIESATDTYAADIYGPGCAHTIVNDVTGEQYIYEVMGPLSEEQGLDCMSEVIEISTLYNSGGCVDL